ncbi:hypothetical protein GCM10009795_004580 [Nocardioides hankookensis]|uniref:Excalibur calcium-binding domain-containing protein n=1 Tax=Nocardioides hankookensis TaxID=443157 RepID=A0ABW1LLZ8_9ACTN
MKSRLIHVALGLVVGLAVAIIAIPAASAPAVAGSVNCSDFGSQASAQRWFINHGGPQSDPAGLDTDHDGVACESNPCPCYYGQGGGGGGGTPGHTGDGSQVGQVHPGPGRCAWNYKDKPTDAPSVINVKRTALDVCRKGYLRVRVFGGDFVRDQTDLVRIYFDTRRGRNGPEFAVDWYMGTNPATAAGSVFFGRSTSWRSSDEVKCKGIHRAVNYRSDVITLAVPRRCLGWPSAVRWSGFTGKITRVTKHTMYGKWDDFPRENALPTKWVA